MPAGATTAKTANTRCNCSVRFAVRIVGSHLYGVVFYNWGCQ